MSIKAILFKMNKLLDTAEMLQTVLLKKFGIHYPILPEIEEPGGEQNAFIIGCCVPASVKGFEIIGITMASEEYAHCRFLYFIPIPENSNIDVTDPNNPILYLKKAVYINQNKELQPVNFSEPVRVDLPIFHSYKGKTLHLNPRIVRDFSRDKRISYLFFKEYRLPTTDIQILVTEPANITESINAVSDQGNSHFVLKPLDGSGGQSVQMFAPHQKEEAENFGLALLQKYGKFIIERRIFSYPVYINNQRIDWNIRFILVFDKDNKPIIDTGLAEVRYKSFDGNPVNVDKGAAVDTLNDFVEKNIVCSNEEKQAFLSELKNVVANFARALIDKLEKMPSVSARKMPIAIGMDLIMDENRHWKIIEFNSGAFGGIQHIFKLNNNNPEVLKNIAKALPREKNITETTTPNPSEIPWYKLNKTYKRFLSKIIFLANTPKLSQLRELLLQLSAYPYLLKLARSLQRRMLASKEISN